MARPGMFTTRRRDVLALAALGMAAGTVRPAKAVTPSGQLTVGVHITLAPTWLDPAETAGIITPFMVMYALHDAVAKPMPQGNPSPSLAESWSAGEDGLSYEFILRKGAVFHNGDPVTSEDVKFSFDRYRGAAHALIKERVESVETPDPQRVVFKLKNPWPDFITFYTVASGAGWVVPKKYVEKVGDDAFKKAPIGAGPYKFVSFTPGVELVLEAFEQYWRKTPSVKRIVLRVIPDESTRLAALKRGEIDIAYSVRAELAEELQRTPGLTLRPTVGSAPYYLYFPEQWDPKSPWYDRRVRLSTKYALDYNTINQALTLGHSHITGSIIPENFEFYEKLAPPVYDPDKAKQLLAEAGHEGGFDAGFYTCDVAYANLGEAALNNLAAVGIRAKLRPLERAAFFKGYGDKKFKNIIQGASGAFGNAATRLQEFVVKGGVYAYGSYPEIDELFPQQAVELDRTKRAAILTKMQKLLDEQTMYVSIWQLAFISGVGPRVDQSGFGLIKGFVYTAPYEDITLKSA
ncbi:MAG TPA: ABC transporter substrate-binding protein [Acetobacteraceae bacterium]|jgi:peptide/nickel transport system substrate-binding protein|nr:ABC transporter substrate-binding protein [Acetobacteraceae bacterium]